MLFQVFFCTTLGMHELVLLAISSHGRYIDRLHKLRVLVLSTALASINDLYFHRSCTSIIHGNARQCPHIVRTLLSWLSDASSCMANRGHVIRGLVHGDS